jgi:hypothetical protein
VESRGADEIDARVADWLANYHYTFFSVDLPRQQQLPRYEEIGGGSREPEVNSEVGGSPR